MLEAEHDWLDDLAEAVADGQAIDWAVLESSAGDDRRRELIRRLRAVAAIGQAHADLTVTDTASDSLSVRSQLPGFDDPSVPTHWGQLRILERVGRGRFGDVYRAWDPSLDREVALKLLRRLDDSAAADREVIDEGRLMARVRHPNVVTIHGAQRIDGRTGLWMEFVEGRTLAAELDERGPFSAAEVAEVGIQLCNALAAVHDAGLVHRDVKAQNVLRDTRGRVVLGDFGTGYELDEERAEPPALAGTPMYLAPELFAGSAASVQSDVYSLGILLFHLATRSYPVTGRSLSEIRSAHAALKRTALSAVRSDLPRALTAAIERSVAYDPADRYRSATAMAADLVATGAPATVDGRRWFPRVAAAALLTTLAGLAAWGAANRIPAAQRPSQTENHTTSTDLAAPVRIPDPVPPTPDQPTTSDTGQPSQRTSSPDFGYRAGMGPGTPAPARAFRQIAGPELAGFGVPSPDGRLLSFRDAGGELSLLDIASRQTRRITGLESGDPEGSIVDRSGFSLDGSRITYLRRSNPVPPAAPTINEIRTIPTTGGKSRLIWRAPDSRVTDLFHWAGDDDLILAAQQTPPSGRELMIISTATGAVIASHALPRPSGRATLSADGRYVAYDFVDPVSGLSDIDLWIVGTNTSVPLIHDSAASDRSPMWTADGRYLLFVSSRSGTNGLWAQRVDKGVPVGVPVGVDPTVQDARLLGITAAGALFVARTVGARDAFVADMDPLTLTVTGAPRRPTSRTGTTGSPAWSPDGQTLAFTRREESRTSIVAKSMADGVEREFTPPLLTGVGKMKWEANSRSLLLQTSVSAKPGVYRFTPDTGQLTPVWLKPFTMHEALPQPGLILVAQQTGPSIAISRANVETGEEQIVHRLAPGDFLVNLVASNRGDRFVYGASSRSKGRMVIGIVELDNPASARDIFVPQTPTAGADPMAWAPDDRHIIVRRSLTETGQPLTDGLFLNRQTLWALDVATGDLRPISPQLAPIIGAAVLPSGRQIAIDAGLPYGEVWTLDNALSVLPR